MTHHPSPGSIRRRSLLLALAGAALPLAAAPASEARASQAQAGIAALETAAGSACSR